MPKGKSAMNAVTQYKLHKFLTDLAEKDDLDVYVASTWKQRLVTLLGVVLGFFVTGIYGLVIGGFIGYSCGQRFMNRKYKALQILQRMDSNQREQLHRKGKEILGDTDIKTLEHLAANDEEAKEKMVHHLQEYLNDFIVNEHKVQNNYIREVSDV